MALHEPARCGGISGVFALAAQRTRRLRAIIADTSAISVRSTRPDPPQAGARPQGSVPPPQRTMPPQVMDQLLPSDQWCLRAVIAGRFGRSRRPLIHWQAIAGLAADHLQLVADIPAKRVAQPEERGAD